MAGWTDRRDEELSRNICIILALTLTETNLIIRTQAGFTTEGMKRCVRHTLSIMRKHGSVPGIIKTVAAIDRRSRIVNGKQLKILLQ